MLNQSNVLIVDLQNSPADTPDAAYKAGHLPGAHFVNWRKDLTDVTNLPYYELPTKEEFQALLRKLGVHTNTHIVLYCNLVNRLAIRAFFVLKYFGHEYASVMEGGIDAWKNAGFSLSTILPPAPAPSSYTIVVENKSMIVDIDYVESVLCDRQHLIVDARPYAMYVGETIGGLIHLGQPIARYGHIYNSISLPWAENMVNGFFKSKEELRELYASRGIHPRGKTIIFECNEGIHAVFDWFVAKYLLCYQNVVVYEGSTGEWADHPLLPMVSGLAPNCCN
jgi:thiosulfate/3-mercaptopyruvate sulfurtransferase